MAGAVKEDVYCTLVMSDSYLPGAAILARSLRDCGTSKKLAVLITLDTLLPSTIQQLRLLYDYVIPIERLANPNLENLVHLNRLDLRYTFSKIALWKQEQFRKIVYIDADIVALRAPDELFDLPHSFAGAPDVGWPDCFNSGVMVLTPNVGEYFSLQTLAASGASFDGADQGLLNEYFANRRWHRLSFTYNCTPSASYQYEPAYRHFKSGISLVHFIGKDKPWTLGKEGMRYSKGGGVYKELLGKWWMVFDRHYKVALSAYSSSQREEETRVVRQYVHGEHVENAWATAGVEPNHVEAPIEQKTTFEPPETTAVTVEPQLTDRAEPEQLIGEEVLEPPPSKQEFSAPFNDWDATRSEPPPESKPEAANFPSEHYEMSEDRSLFKIPEYPAPPKDMYYEVPSIKPGFNEPPKPIFPWETDKNRPVATRVFAEDIVPSPVAPPEPEPAPLSDSAATREEQIQVLQEAATLVKSKGDPYSQSSRTNAWDEVPSIDHYVRAVKDIQARRGKIQVLHSVSSATTEDTTEDVINTVQKSPRKNRKESLILTDFPSEIERPSLPVTPAPIRRPTFWGEDKDAEKDGEGDLVTAQGVPEQADWDPVERLEELRRASIIAPSELPLSPTKDIPTREMPANAAPLPSSPPAVVSTQTSYITATQ